MQITSKGQITIPKHIREYAGLLPNTEAEFLLENGRVVLQKRTSRKFRSKRGEQLIAHMRQFADKTNGLSADEIMAMTRGE